MPTAVIHDTHAIGGATKYRMVERLLARAVNRFVEDFRAGKLPSYLPGKLKWELR